MHLKDLTFQNSTTDGVQEVQELRINSTAKSPFVLAFDGANTGKIIFHKNISFSLTFI